MKITLVVIGKTDASYLAESHRHLSEPAFPLHPFDMEVIPDVKNTKHLTEAQQKEREGELILKALQPGDHVVLLDEKGREFTSLQFAAYVEKKMHTVPKRLVCLSLAALMASVRLSMTSHPRRWH